ncbi:hypothetical protein DFH29DRAFT_1078810 [Suillus ampliporus]|nr:hypothetical protein DFH29DRAFT_1078810 [Suillus ampliporus]
MPSSHPTSNSSVLPSSSSSEVSAPPPTPSPNSTSFTPLLVLPFARATNGLGVQFSEVKWAAYHTRARQEELDAPLTLKDVLCDWNPSMPDHTASFDTALEMRMPPSQHLPHTPLFHQIIYVASLLHDDVLDKSPLRRGAASAPAAFGSKLSVLDRGFLLGRASAALSRPGSNETVEPIASVIANLVEGEIFQMKGHGGEAASSLASSSASSAQSPFTTAHCAYDLG